MHQIFGALIIGIAAVAAGCNHGPEPFEGTIRYVLEASDPRDPSQTFRQTHTYWVKGEWYKKAESGVNPQTGQPDSIITIVMPGPDSVVVYALRPLQQAGMRTSMPRAEYEKQYLRPMQGSRGFRRLANLPDTASRIMGLEALRSVYTLDNGLMQTQVEFWSTPEFSLPIALRAELQYPRPDSITEMVIRNVIHMRMKDVAVFTHLEAAEFEERNLADAEFEAPGGYRIAHVPRQRKAAPWAAPVPPDSARVQ